MRKIRLIVLSLLLALGLSSTSQAQIDTTILVCGFPGIPVMDSLMLITSGPVACPGDSNAWAKVLVFGAVGPISIDWEYSLNPPLVISGDGTDSVFGLWAGAYEVTVTDTGDGQNTCAIGFAIGTPIPITLTFFPALPITSCFGVCDGMVGVTAANGTPPYTYAWNNPSIDTDFFADSLCVGMVTVLVLDNNGCPKSDSILVNEPTQLAANVSGTDLTCGSASDGTVQSAASGGTPPYTYAWDNGPITSSQTGLGLGTYCVTVTDSKGCEDNDCFTVANPPPLTLLMDSTNESCGGSCDGVVRVVGGGGTAPYTYQWNDGLLQTNDSAFALCVGMYTVVVTDILGCSDSDSIAVGSPPILTVTTDTIHILCNGDSTGSAIALPLGGSGSYTYSWDNGQTTDTAIDLVAGNYCVTVTDILGCQDLGCAEVLEPAPLVLTTDSIDPFCFDSCDGSAIVEPSGGAGGFLYSWNDPSTQTTDTATALCSGLYRVVVTDANGCRDTSFVNLDDPPIITLTTDSVDVTCFEECDGSAIANAGGGTGTLTYLWNDLSAQTTNTATGLCAGTYRVIVTDGNGCRDTAFVNVDEPTDLVLNTDSLDVACGGTCTGQAMVSATGGTPAYTYAWNDGLSQTTDTAFALCTGLYEIIVTDNNGCDDTAFVNIDEPVVLTVVVDSTFITCFGADDGTATATASDGTSPYTYLWSNGATTSTVTGLGPVPSFCVTVTDNLGCQESGCVEIFEPAELTVTMSSTDMTCNALCDGTGTATEAGGTPPYTYTWDDPDAQTNSTATGLCAGIFRVTVTDGSGCFVTDSVTIIEPTPILANSSTVPATCGLTDGMAIVSPSGGNPCGGPTAYLINWFSNGPTLNDSLTGLGSGCYDVEIMDCSTPTACRDTSVVCVSDISATVLVMSDTNIACNGDSNGIGMVNATLGTPPYTFLWDDPLLQADSIADSLPPGTWTVTVEDAIGCIVFGSVTITEPPLLTVTMDSTDVSCFGVCDGKVVATPAGGTLPYTFLWETGASIDSITAVCPGFWSVTITDSNGCTAIDSAEVNDQILLTVATDSIDILCFGDVTGSAIAAPAGGVPPYTILWTPTGQTSDTATGLDTGLYCVLVTDSNSCTATACVNLDEPLLLSVAMSQVDVLCFGVCEGTGTATPAGGTTPYTFAWSNGDSGGTADSLCAGKFFVTVTDGNGCTLIDSVIITQPPAYTTAMTQTNVSCFNRCDATGSVTVGGGVPAYTYLWSNTDTGFTADSLCAGKAFVTVTDANGCVAIDSVDITEPDTLALTADSIDILCNAECTGQADVNTTGGTLPYTFLWDDPGFQSDSTATGLCVGAYCVTVTDFNGCTNSICLNIDEPAPISPNFDTASATCGIVPCDGMASSAPTGGVPAYTFNWTDAPTSTNDTIFQLCAGVYNLEITDGNGCTESFSVGISDLGAPIIDSLDSTMVTCFGDSDGTSTVHIIPGSGNPPYTFLWNDPLAQADSTADSLPAGTWFNTITDIIGCIVIADVIITEPAEIISFLLDSNVTCEGFCDGNVVTSPSGGVGAYTHIWNPGGSTDSALTGLCPGTYIDTIRDFTGCFIVDSAVITEPTVLTVTITDSTNISCNGLCDGDATATPSGGTTPYTYSWSTGPTQTNATVAGLCAGVLVTVTVTDANGCVDLTTVTLSEPAVLAASIIDSTNISCFGSCDGDATVGLSGGTIPYTYNWNNSPGFDTDSLADSLCAGTTYKVIVTDLNGCQDSAVVTLSEPVLLTATIFDSTNVNCNAVCSGTATAVEAGGTGPYAFSWNNAPDNDTDSIADSLCAGTYTVTITDALGCTALDSVTITEPPALIVAISDSSNISCNGLCDGFAVGSASGGSSPYTFTWTPSGTSNDTLTGLCPGTVDTLVVEDTQGCLDTVMVTLSEPGVLTVSVTDSVNASCFGLCDGIARTTTVGGTPTYTYAWSLSADTLDSAIALCADTMNVVTVTDSNGCTASDSVMLAQPPELFAAITDSTDASCFGLCDGQAVITGSGGTPGLNVIWQSGETTDTATALCADSNLYGVVTDTIGCTDTAFFSISQPVEIAITFTDSSDALCEGNCDGSATVSLAGGNTPYNIVWSNGDTGVVADSLCAGLVIMTVTDSTGCTNSDSITISEPTPFTVDTVSTTSAACDSTCDAMAVVFGTGGTTPYTFTWNDSAGTVNDTAINLCASTYTVIGTDSNGCTSTDTVVITGPDSLTLVIDTITNTSCSGISDGSATVQAFGGVGAYTYSWIDTSLAPAGTIAGPGPLDSTISDLAAGTYFAVVTDANGCNATVPVTISEPDPLSANVCDTANVTCNLACDGGAQVCPLGGTAPYTFIWDDALAQTDSIADSLCAGSYSVTVTDANGCTAQDSLIVIEEPTLLSCLFSDTGATGCGADSATGFAVVVGNGGTPPYQYVWDILPVGSETDTLADTLLAGTYNVTVSDTNNCTSICTIEITDTSNMSAAITDSGMVSCFGACDGFATVTTSGSTQPYTYEWFDFNNVSIGDFDSTGNDLCDSIHRVIVGSATACFRSIPITITQPDSLVAVISDTIMPLCNADSNGYLVAGPTGGTPPYTYSWCDTSGTILDTLDTLAMIPAGDYCLVVTDSNGCIDSSVITLGEPAQLVISIIDTATVQPACSNTCDGQLFTATTGGTATYTYFWNDTAGTASDTLFIVCVDTFVVTVTDTNGCSASDTTVVTPLITVNANAGLDQQICQNDTLVLISDTLGSTFQWFLDTTLTVIGTDDTLTTVPGFTGPHTYILVVGDSICSDTDSVAVYIVPVAVNACCDQTIALGECVDLIGTVTNGVTFDWTPATTLDDPSSATPEACPDESTTYTLTAINDSGCVGTDSVFIQVEPDIPDGFTPQGDGFNDVWEIALLNNYPNAEVQVYNRWGQLVFDSPEGDMYAVKFDGTYNGKDLPVGTYYFVINLNDGITEPITGPLTIMR